MEHGNRKVIGVGLPKTGTTSLNACFKILNIVPVAGCRTDLKQKFKEGNINELLAEADHFRSFEDTPWCKLFRELDQRFPGSKFILTTRRDAHTRVVSAWNGAVRKGRRQGEMSLDFLADKVQEYESHNAAVREHFKDRPDDLLEVCWEKGDGWPQLCEFLELPVPKRSFPHKNAAKDFRVKRHHLLRLRTLITSFFHE